MRQPAARPGRRGRLFVMGLLGAGSLVTALGVWLRAEVGKVPRELARRIARLEESGDFARFRVELEELLQANPPFREAFRDVLPVPPAAFAEPPPVSQGVALLAPLGVVPRSGNAPLQVRWFDSRPTRLEAARSIRVRLCPERACAGQEPAPPETPRAGERPHGADESRESAALTLANTRRLEDGSFAAELDCPPAAAEGWLRLRLVAGDSNEGDAAEDQGWFRTTEARDPGRPPLADARYALLRICGQGRMTPSQADLLLAMLLEERRFDLAEARLLELLRAESRSSRASERLLRSAYGRLRRHDGLPREPARREDAANWAGTRNP